MSRKDEIFGDAIRVIDQNYGTSPKFLETFYAFSFSPQDKNPDSQEECFTLQRKIPKEFTEENVEIPLDSMKFSEPSWIQYPIIMNLSSSLERMLTDLTGIINKDSYAFLHPSESNTLEPLIHLAAKCGSLNCLLVLKKHFNDFSLFKQDKADEDDYDFSIVMANEFSTPWYQELKFQFEGKTPFQLAIESGDYNTIIFILKEIFVNGISFEMRNEFLNLLISKKRRNFQL